MYGTGKTTTSREEFYKHAFITPHGNTLIGAHILPQYEQTIKRDIEKDIPKAFIENVSAQKAYVDLINAHRLMYRPLDDADKLRSYNLSMFIIVEASEVDGEIFTQLKTRLRSSAAILPKRDAKGNIIYKRIGNATVPVEATNWTKGIIESNPDSGWLKRHVLEVSSQIYRHGNTMDKVEPDPEIADPAISSHICASDANPYLPKDFKNNLIKNKPLYWVARYFYGSFSYAEGLVYPAAAQCICETFQVPAHWRRICAFDYGLNDDSAWVFGAVSPKENVLYIYKEIVINNRNIRELADLFKEGSRDIAPGNWICPPIIDPKSAPKRDYEKKSLADHFLEYGIVFKPGFVNLDARIYALNTYFESGRLKIMDCCKYLIKELKDYKFQERTLTNDAVSAKPVDKNNHAINPLEWIVMELPKDPANLVHGVYNRHGINVEDEAVQRTDSIAYGTFALMDTEPEQNDNVYEMEDYL